MTFSVNTAVCELRSLFAYVQYVIGALQMHQLDDDDDYEKSREYGQGLKLSLWLLVKGTLCYR